MTIFINESLNYFNWFIKNKWLIKSFYSTSLIKRTDSFRKWLCLNLHTLVSSCFFRISTLIAMRPSSIGCIALLPFTIHQVFTRCKLQKFIRNSVFSVLLLRNKDILIFSKKKIFAYYIVGMYAYLYIAAVFICESFNYYFNQFV